MKLNVVVTLLAPIVLMLASINTALADTAVSSTTSVTKTTASDAPDFKMALNISRSTNLIDFQDGSRHDGIDYEFSPSLKIPMGTFSSRIAYSQDLRDLSSSSASDWADIPLIYSFNGNKWKWNRNETAKLSYSLTAVLPVSKTSTKKDELQTSLSGRISLMITPNDGEGFTYGAGVSLGQNIHAYEEDINGSVLNKYSSNQNISLSYGLESWSISLDFVNKTRLTYKNNVKSAFELTQEIGYSYNGNIAMAVGHTNAGSTLKANGTDSNIDIINENNSTIYVSLNLSY